MAKIRHVLETQQFKERKILNELFGLADDMRLFDRPDLTDEELEKCKQLRFPQEPRRKLLANLFYEPSTRTRLSFHSAMDKLGGSVMGTEAAAQFSSAFKGESLPDSAHVIADICDVVVLRHPEEGAAKMAARYSPVPIINAGDGPGQHPTQALLDLYTIKRELDRMGDLKVGMLGDLKNGRTVRSLSYLLAHRDNIRLFFISPEELRMREDITKYLKDMETPFEEVGGEQLKDVARGLDVLYVTRVQKERFKKDDGSPDDEAYKRVKGSYIVNRNIIDVMGCDSIVMHPMPRIDEIDREIDNDPRAAYFRQAENGLYVRMALLKMVLSEEGQISPEEAL